MGGCCSCGKQCTTRQTGWDVVGQEEEVDGGSSDEGHTQSRWILAPGKASHHGV